MHSASDPSRANPADDDSSVPSSAEAMRGMLELPSELLFDEVPCYITIHDRDFRIQRANRKFTADFGPRLGEFCYKAYKDRDERCENCSVEEAFRDGVIHSSRQTVRSQSGDPIELMVYAAPLRDPAGNVVAVMEMSTDITEATRLQSQLATLGQLVASLAHSIKGIVMALDGGLYVVNSGFGRQDDRKVQEGWLMVQESVERVRALVMDILCCSKPRDPEREKVCLGNIVDDVCELLREKADRARVAFHRRFGAGAGRLMADPKGLHIVLVNLLTNAIEACDGDQEEGPHEVTVGIEDQPETVILTVSDDGAGMTEEAAAKMFEVFASTKGSAGTGLGLFLSRKIVMEHGGSIGVASQLGTGAAFTLRLPRGGPPDQIAN